MEEPESSKKKNKKNKGLRDFAKYSGLAFQMVGIILVAVLGGSKLDELSGNEVPVYTIILSLFGVFSAIYIAVKDFIK